MPNVLWYYSVASIGLVLVLLTFIMKKPLVESIPSG